MKIGIIGYGQQGRSAYDYWNKDGNQITVCDQQTDLDLPNDVEKCLGPDHLKNLDRFDLIIRSPILHPNDLVEANAPSILRKVTTVTNEFMRVSPTKNIIGVTGTKGKGTTSTLITKMLEASGQRVHLGGNIGIPPLELLGRNISASDWVVLELANFQIIDLVYSPHIAVVLMLVPEHLDWHATMNDYIESKSNLFAHQKTDDVAIYFARNDHSESLANRSPGVKIPYYHLPGGRVRDDGMIVVGENEVEVLHKTEVKLLGEHNLQNICAALTAVWQITQDVAAIQSVLRSFTGLEHRLELVRELDGVKYYDDSFGTTPETALVAMQAFEQPKIMILGGSDKGIAFDSLAEGVVKLRVKHAIVIGDTSAKIIELLAARGFTNVTTGLTEMSEIVAAAKKVAQPGDVVLLSTGCASFGLFENYKDRGEQFKKAVASLS